MKIFAIRDESAQEQKNLAYLLYYEQEKRFYIELPENAHRMITISFPLMRRDFRKKLQSVFQSGSRMCCRWRIIACWCFSGMAW